jgi:REP element-mobilizing transposase RayT
MSHPLAWFITWTTYGTWLHGDARGSFVDGKYQPPSAELERANRSAMTGEVIQLTSHQRSLVDAVLVNECQAQGWDLQAGNVRTNHVHVVVSAACDGKVIRTRLKALASKALSDDANLPMSDDNGRKRWWTEKGNIVPVEDERSLDAICVYARELQ